ncbi:hypothetical protein ACP70R_024268 [Stipagrostis hirtigluma subsp. patula]
MERKTGTTAPGVVFIQTREDLVHKLDMAGSKLVVLNFRAPWNKASKSIIRPCEDLAKDFKTKAEFYALNVDKFMELVKDLGVEALPTFVLFRNYEMIDKVVGMETDKLRKSIEKAVAEPQETAHISNNQALNGVVLPLPMTSSQRVGQPTERKTGVISIETREDLVQKLNMAGSKLVVLDFWAPWNKTSTSLKKPFEVLADNFKTNADFYTLNVDKFMELAKHCGVEALPTVVLFRNHEMIDKVVGVEPDELSKKIEKALAAS